MTRRINSYFFSCLTLALLAGLGAPASAVIQGYGELTVFQGDTAHLRVRCSADQKQYTIEWQRYDIPMDTVATSGPYDCVNQPDLVDDAYKSGYKWSVSNTFAIPADWPSDLYAARLVDHKGEDFYIPIIVKARPIGSQSNIAVLAATMTWQAYNASGGASFYRCYRESCQTTRADGKGGEIVQAVRAPLVTFDRPFDNARPQNTGQNGDVERYMGSYLKKAGYRFEQISDTDLHFASPGSGFLDPYKILIIHTHSEYWSREMINNFQAFLDRGGKALNFSGNTMYWKVTMDGPMLESRKGDGHGYTHEQTGEKGGLWRHLINGGEYKILGAGFDRGGAQGQCVGINIDFGGHWVFKNTGVKGGDVAGSDGLNNRKGACDSLDENGERIGGASGWEVDVRNSDSPPLCDKTRSGGCVELLGKGVNLENNAAKGVCRIRGADMYLYHRYPAGSIFAVPSLTFTGSLINDVRMQGIVDNVLDAFLSGSIPPPSVNADPTPYEPLCPSSQKSSDRF